MDIYLVKCRFLLRFNIRAVVARGRVDPDPVPELVFCPSLTSRLTWSVNHGGYAQAQNARACGEV